MYKIFRALASAMLIFLVACAPTTPNLTPRPTASPAILTQSTKTVASISGCTYFGRQTPQADGPSLFPVVSSQEHIKGPADAYLTIVSYSDFQCPACAQFAILLAQIQQKHPQDIRLVYRPFPLITTNNKAALSVQAAEAANLQGKFWEMHDMLFAKQAEWVELEPAKFQEWVGEEAATLGLDEAKFKTDLTSPEMLAIPPKAWNAGVKIPLPGVPFFLVNGEILKWQPTLLNNLEPIINLYLLPAKQFSSCPPTVIDPAKQYSATLKTVKGDIVIRLFADKAPQTVNNFVFLAREGWYDNISFHRVLPGFVAQTGDPSGTGQGHPGYFVPEEIDPSLTYDRPGVVGIANSGPGTSGSQFFITYAAAASLNGKYTVFGELISGMDVLNQLTPRNALPGETPPEGDLLISVTINEK